MSSDVHRWYKAFRSGGRADIRIQQIANAVHNFGVGKYIPVALVEKKPRGDFYIFVAVEGPAPGVVPSEVEAFFQSGALGQPLPYVFEREQIRGMVSGEVDVQDFARRIPYRPPEAFLWADPFDDVPDAHTVHLLDPVAECKQFERLLSWLSAVGTGSWSLFQGACLGLGLSGEGSGRRGAQRVLRGERLLGNVEISPEGTHWTVAPTTLCQISEGVAAENPQEFVLCGARDSALLQALCRLADVQTCPQESGAGSPTITVRGSLEDLRSQLGTKAFVTSQSSLMLATVVPAITDWPLYLPELPNINPHLFDCKRFDGRSFVDEAFAGRTGFYELWQPKPQSAWTPPQYPDYRAFFDATRNRWVRGDWYGLRYLSHTTQQARCPVQYQASTRRLAVPYEWRWPELYERTLVLASGRLPRVANDRTWLLYDRISPDLLSLLQPKLQLHVDMMMA